MPSQEQAVRDLKVPIQDIIKQIRPEIEQGAYRLIIGDDASGRIPAFIVGHVCKKIYEKNGLTPPHVRFIAGSTMLDDQAREKKLGLVTEQIAKIRSRVAQNSNTNGKVLIVTDTISSGLSMGVLMEALKANNWQADVATIGLLKDTFDIFDRKRRGFEKQWGTRIIYSLNSTPDVYKRKSLSGVTKDAPQLFAVPTGDSEEVRAARAVAQKIADDISAVPYRKGLRRFSGE